MDSWTYGESALMIAAGIPALSVSDVIVATAGTCLIADTSGRGPPERSPNFG
jgi:hypothetical protein